MFKKNLYFLLACCNLSLLLAACQQNAATDDSSNPTAVTPVTVVKPATGMMSDQFVLSAHSAYLQKNYVKSNATGYVQQAFTRPGAYVKRGQLLFTIKTKEAQSIGNVINKLDSSFRFSGVNRIYAATNGYVTQMAHQQGDYVQDGEQLAVISDHTSFAFIMEVPYELDSLIAHNRTVSLALPDGRILSGRVNDPMPGVDTLSQTSAYVVKIDQTDQLPENLVVKVQLFKSFKKNAQRLPITALLADETLKDFWVMKAINDSTAVKVPVTKGIESAGQVEILSPVFKSTDRIVASGNYGLGDTAKIKIQ